MDSSSTFGISNKAWNCIAHLFRRKSKPGRPRLHSPRSVLNAILYIGKTGCQWNLLPSAFPPWKTVYHYFRKWAHSELFEKISRKLRKKYRMMLDKEEKPTLVIIDSQSVKSSPKAHSRGYDGNKKVSGKKRHLMIDSLGIILSVLYLRANLHDIKGGKCLVAQTKDESIYDKVMEIHGDKAYRGINDPRIGNCST